MNDKKRKMVLDWMRKIHQLEYAHRFESIYYVSIEKWLGVSAFVVTTLVAFSYRLPAVDGNTYQRLPLLLEHQYFVPLASTLAAILTGLLTFLKPSEKAETHKKTGSNYEKLRHRIELILTSPLTEVEVDRKLRALKEDWDSLDAINVSSKFFNEGKKKVLSFKKYPKELDFLDDIHV